MHTAADLNTSSVNHSMCHCQGCSLTEPVSTHMFSCRAEDKVDLFQRVLARKAGFLQ